MRTDDTRCCCRIKLRVHEQTQRLKLNMEQVRIIYADLPEYEGEYTVTPSEQAQMLETAERRMTGNIVINPIPSNYGLITWDGHKITVS